jgi:hypothetical protein
MGDENANTAIAVAEGHFHGDTARGHSWSSHFNVTTQTRPEFTYGIPSNFFGLQPLRIKADFAVGTDFTDHEGVDVLDL